MNLDLFIVVLLSLYVAFMKWYLFPVKWRRKGTSHARPSLSVNGWADPVGPYAGWPGEVEEPDGLPGRAEAGEAGADSGMGMTRARAAKGDSPDGREGSPPVNRTKTGRRSGPESRTDKKAASRPQQAAVKEKESKPTPPPEKPARSPVKAAPLPKKPTPPPEKPARSPVKATPLPKKPTPPQPKAARSAGRAGAPAPAAPKGHSRPPPAENGPAIDRQAALDLSNTIIAAIARGEHAEVYRRMGRAYRDAVPENVIGAMIDEMNAAYGGPMIATDLAPDEARPGREAGGPEGAGYTFRYSVRTEYGKGTYTFFIEIVREGDGLACADFFYLTPRANP